MKKEVQSKFSLVSGIEKDTDYHKPSLVSCEFPFHHKGRGFDETSQWNFLLCQLVV